MFGRTPMKTATPPMLLTTTMTLQRPYTELGLVYSYMGQFQYDQAFKALEQQAHKLYPEADAVIGILIQQKGLGFGLVGTAVRYTTERTETWTRSQSET